MQKYTRFLAPVAVALLALVAVVGWSTAADAATSAEHRIIININQVAGLELEGDTHFNFYFEAGDFTESGETQEQFSDKDTTVKYFTNQSAAKKITAEMSPASGDFTGITIKAQIDGPQGNGSCGSLSQQEMELIMNSTLDVITGIKTAACSFDVGYSVQAGVQAQPGHREAKVLWTLTD